MIEAGHSTDELRLLCERTLERFNAGDHDGVSEFYKLETHFLAPDFTRITTREGVRKFWRNTFGAGYRFEKVETIQIQSGGDMAYWLFNWVMTNPDGKGGVATQTGKNVIVWERSNSDWLISLDSWNSPS